MSNNSPEKERKKLSYQNRRFKTQSHPHFKEVTERHIVTYRRLLGNNQYLLRLRGKSLVGQLREFNENGLKMTMTCYRQILSGEWISTNYAIPYYLSDYWGISVEDLLFKDLRLMDDMDRVKKGLRDGSPFLD